jgi:DNA polymerase I-like protein with 3'-5' exonuclease and polymerase domains
MVLLWEYIKNHSHIDIVKIVNCVHDELIIEVREDLKEEYTFILAKCMQDAGNYYVQSDVIKMESDAETGSSWGTAKG